MLKFINTLKYYYFYVFKSPVEFARFLGVKVGNGCMIATRRWSSEPYLVSIGNHVQITAGVAIHTHGGANIIRKEIPNFDSFGKVTICDWAYIGAYSQIMPGVTIGEGAIIAAGSIVTKSVPPYIVVAGNPARQIMTTEDFVKKNLPYNINTKGMSKQGKKEYLLALPDDMFIKK